VFDFKSSLRRKLFVFELCLRVASSSSVFDFEIRVRGQFRTPVLETNHEQTLSVRYVFRNHLISGERDPLAGRRSVYAGNRRMSHREPARAAGANGGRITNAPAVERFASSELSW
jgi:hypothetical protein